MVSRRFLTKKAVAERQGVTTRTIDRWMRKGLFPPPVKLTAAGGCRWPEHLLVEWEDARIDEAAAHKDIDSTASGLGH
jgi:predicted DNA-binding transcriptional regulator AlpA